ncbi:hypothetical protein [Fulvimonas soli]|uniref:Uncharacterized protein n=1 Tax=Fulvimonas soli TaxID=155197 RepID=A0A316IAR0_9GAMM|nr:hypothetical protein [Fulvimonas soli]PWK89809.1 hypothetical protein C7456_104162 [Fulvimonas soli]TNY27552.1 hypothetical protein BV497_02470 [Fulvimonas soli]
MRVFIAGIVGGIVVFLWGAIAHTALGLGNVGLRPPAAEDKVLGVLHEGLGDDPGVYVLPWLGPEKMGDRAAVQAYSDKSSASPYAWIIYQPRGKDMTRMGRQLFHQWLSNTLAALALAFVMTLAALTFRQRLGLALAAALFAWLGVQVPYWTWYRFPGDFTLAALVEQVVGWLLAGAAMAWWIGWSERRAAR